MSECSCGVKRARRDTDSSSKRRSEHSRALSERKSRPPEPGRQELRSRDDVAEKEA
jgi:hypothetical protein